METIVITIRPRDNGDDRLTLTDSFLQILNLQKLFDEAGRSLVEQVGGYEWRLIRAETNSPFTVEITAVGQLSTFDAPFFVKSVFERFSHDLGRLSTEGSVPSWMDDDGVAVARDVFQRLRTGVGEIEIGNGNGHRTTLVHEDAESGLRALEAYETSPPEVSAGVGEEVAQGEIEGAFVMAGVYRRKPAICIYSRQYRRRIWCILPADFSERYGEQHKLSEVWQQRAVAVEGRVVFRGGIPSRVVAEDVRLLPAPRPILLEDVRDPDFTGGLDAVEYIYRFREGELAR